MHSDSKSYRYLGYCNTAYYSATFFEFIGWLQGPTVCSQANTAPSYILTSEVCTTLQNAAIHFIYTLQNKTRTFVVEN